jgi:hypothetical protein
VVRSKQTHSFTLVLSGVGEITDELENALFDAGCGDALLGCRDGVVYLDFDRVAKSTQQAMLSAIRDVQKTGFPIRVYRVEPDDLVNASEIARRAKRTRESVRKLIIGIRGPGGFPPPISSLTRRSPIWRWTEVAAWFARNLQLADSLDSEAARSIARINAMLELNRQGLKPSEIRAFDVVLTPTRSKDARRKTRTAKR